MGALALIVCAVLVPQAVWSQFQPEYVALTRGKFWGTMSDAGTEVNGREGRANINYAYPGSYSSDNMMFGALPLDVLMVKTPEQGVIPAQQYLVMRQGTDPSVWVSDFKHELHQNYNFVNSLTEPEEWSWGRSRSYDPEPEDDSYPLLYEKSIYRAVWSLPEYDDFIINIVTIKNVDIRPWSDAYFGLWKPVTMTEAGRVRFSNDLEYRWEEDLETFGDENGGFVFYDDTSWPGFGTTPATYTIPPGDVTGDIGDPGNIKEQNSVDRRLYSPQAITESYIDCTPNKNGIKKFWYGIRNCEDGWLNWSSNNAPDSETLPWFQGNYETYSTWVTDEQPRVDYKEAQQMALPGAGNTWERTPIYMRFIGPYDLAPGDSVEVVWFHVGGDMDRNISMKGGLEATQQLPDVSIDDLKQNWAAAMRIYKGWINSGKTDWNAAITQYPPPTPGSAPRIGNEDELIVEAFAEPGVGQGYTLRWVPVPDDYVDPLTGVNDFVGYRVYKSEIGIEGPWELVDELAKGNAVIGSDGRVEYALVSKAGIPTRFGVTTYDTDGNESGMSAHSYFALTAPLAPSNDLSKVLVVPSPFRQVSGFLDAREAKRLTFVNVPSRCTIRIYTVAGDLVQTLEHEGFGEKAWGSNTSNDYLLTRFATNVAPGIYYYHVESHVSGHEGETATGKFAIIK
jgi:hypothetical protein